MLQVLWVQLLGIEGQIYKGLWDLDIPAKCLGRLSEVSNAYVFLKIFMKYLKKLNFYLGFLWTVNFASTAVIFINIKSF